MKDLDRPIKEGLSGVKGCDEIELKSSIYIKNVRVNCRKMGSGSKPMIEAPTFWSSALTKLVDKSNLRAFAIFADTIMIVSIVSK